MALHVCLTLRFASSWEMGGGMTSRIGQPSHREGHIISWVGLCI